MTYSKALAIIVRAYDELAGLCEIEEVAEKAVAELMGLGVDQVTATEWVYRGLGRI